MADTSIQTPLLRDTHSLSGDGTGQTYTFTEYPSSQAPVEEAQSTEPGPLPVQVQALTYLSAASAFLYGYDTAVMSGALILLKKQFDLDDFWQQLVVSTTVAAAAVTGLIGGYLNDIFGRKPNNLAASCMFTVGAIVLGTCVNKHLLLCGQFIIGASIGLVCTSVPLYIGECAPVNLRGFLTTMKSLGITFGQFFANISVGIFNFDKQNGWRYALGITGVFSIIQFIGMLYMPESPCWLMYKEREEQARDVLQVLRGRKDVDFELQEIKQSCLERKNAKSYGKLIKKMLTTYHVRKALIIGCAVQMFQQLCGVNTIMYYGGTLIKMAGVRSDQAAIWLSALPAAMNFLFTFVGLALVERIGRRPLIAGSLAGTTLSLVMIAITFHITVLNSPAVTLHDPKDNTSTCSLYSSCASCVGDPSCGFCSIDEPPGPTNGSCDPISTKYSASSGRCTSHRLLESNSTLSWDSEFCPSTKSWMVVLGLMLYLVVYSPGMGCIPHTITAEIFPIWARSTGISICMAVNLTCNFTISMTFLSLCVALTTAGVFWLLALFSVIGVVFILCFLPETRGKRLSEIEELFSSPWYG